MSPHIVHSLFQSTPGLLIFGCLLGCGIPLFCTVRDDRLHLALQCFLPIQLHQQIWSKVFLKEVFQEKSINFDDLSQIASFKFHKPQIRTLSEEIIKVIPSWLMYGSRNQVKNDLVCIFENMGVLFQKA